MSVESPFNFIHIPKNAGTSIRSLCGTTIRYNNHATDVTDPAIIRQLVVLRNPIERFVSAFYYSMEYYRHTRNIQDLVYHYIVTPNRIIEAIRNPQHPHHMKVLAMMNNDGTQKIGSYTPPHRWIYSPQHHYVHQPQFVLLFEHLSTEWPQFAKHHHLEVGEFPHQNHTKKRYLEPLTAQSVTFLQRFYQRDFELYQHYSELELQSRISGIEYT